MTGRRVRGTHSTDELTASRPHPRGLGAVAIVEYHGHSCGHRAMPGAAASFAWRDLIAGTSLAVGGNGAQSFR